MDPVDVRDLLERPGASRHLRREEEVEGLRTELASAEDRPLTMDLVLESVEEGIFVTGPVRGSWTLSCARCLKPVDRDFELDVAELFAREPDEDDETYAMGEDEVDLEPMLRDAVVLAMPFAPLCLPDCAGLCERCGGDRNLDECSCPPPVDPRWRVLDSLDLR